MGNASLKINSKVDNALSQVIERRFTKELEKNPDKTVYDLFKWEKRDVLLGGMFPPRFYV